MRLLALTVFLAPAAASAKPAPAPPPAQRALSCESREFNGETASVDVQADGVHVQIGARHKLAQLLKLDFPKDKAHKPLRAVAGGGTLEVVFPLASCQFGAQPGLVGCGTGPDAVKLTVTGSGPKAKPATFDSTTVGLVTSRIDTTSVYETTTRYAVELHWGANSNTAASARVEFEPNTCTVK